MDAFNVTMSATVEQYGWQTILNVAEDVEELPNFPITEWGDLVAESRQKQSGFWFETKTYSKAKEILENGSVKTQFDIPESITFLSLDEDRANEFDEMTALLDYEYVYVKRGADKWGVGGWTSLGIIEQLRSDFNLDFYVDFNAFIDYDIAYYRIAPYGSIVNEFKRMYSGFPLLLVYEAIEGTPRITAKLPAHAMDVFDLSLPQFSNNKTSVSFTPQRKVQVLVVGDWGEPVYDGEDASFQRGYEVEGVSDILGDIKWFQTSPEGARGTKIPSYISGTLTGANFAKDDLNVEEFTWENIQDASYTQNIKTEGSRYEAITRAGQKIATIASKSEQVHLTKHVTGQDVELKTVTYNGQDITALSYGESLSEIRCIINVSRTMQTSDIPFDEEYSEINHLPTSYSVTYTMYEGNSGTGEHKMVHLGADNNIPKGTLKERLTIKYGLYVQSSDDYNSGSKKGVRQIVAPLQEDADNVYLFAEEQRTIENFEPSGAAGFNRSITTITTSYVGGSNPRVQYTVQGGSGDANTFVPQIHRGDGFARIYGRDWTASDGETEQINIPTCSVTKANELAEALMTYRHGFYTITVTKEEDLCDVDSASDMTFPFPNTIPGEAEANVGTIISINRTISPIKMFTTTQYRRYRDT